MTKSELIEALAKAEGITLKAAETAVNVTFQSMEQALVSSDRLEIRGFGSFKVKDYEGYKGRNPKTGVLIEVSSKKLPFFKVGKELKERVNGADVIDAPVKVKSIKNLSVCDRKSVKITGVDFLEEIDTFDPAHRTSLATPLDHLFDLVRLSF